MVVDNIYQKMKCTNHDQEMILIDSSDSGRYD